MFLTDKPVFKIFFAASVLLVTGAATNSALAMQAQPQAAAVAGGQEAPQQAPPPPRLPAAGLRTYSYCQCTAWGTSPNAAARHAIGNRHSELMQGD